ncbi:MAG: hypothetical protein R6V38_00775 [Roseovarius gahaiensis]
MPDTLTTVAQGSGRWVRAALSLQMRGTGKSAVLASLTDRLMRDFGLGRDDVFVARLLADDAFLSGQTGLGAGLLIPR